MSVPGLAPVVAATQSLAVVLDHPGAADLRERLDAAETPVSAVTEDLVRVVYRLLFVALARRRGAYVDEARALASLSPGPLPLELLDHELLAEVTADLGQGAPDDVVALGALHEAMLELQPAWDSRQGYRMAGTAGSGRKVAGAYFTPQALVDHLLDEALEPVLDEVAGDPLAVTVYDPACGSGLFLLAAARRIARRGATLEAALSRCVVGVDRDPAAVELARVCLWLSLVEPGQAARMPELRLSVDDALLGAGPAQEFDVVLGNPPFLSQLQRLTTSTTPVAARLNELAGGTLRPYTDVSAAFLQRSVSWVRTGGRVALVQPQSLLAARDAAGVRAYLASTCALVSLWASDVPVFEASVLTCAPVLQRGGEQRAVRRSHGPGFEPVAPRPVGAGELRGEWSFLLAAGLGIPEVALARRRGVLSDLADCTADFRDQYYGLAPFVREAADADGARFAPLVTTGLIEPAECLWGRTPTRFQKRRWAAPVVDLDALEARPALARWATARLVPKVLVGTQGRVIEAVVDTEGRWLPSVPTITVQAPPERLWHVLAVFVAPPVVAHAAATYAGTALSMRAIKLSAAQVGRLPLPADRDPWDEAAVAVAQAQQDAGRRAALLAHAAALMCQAYGEADDSVLEWWLLRASLSSRR